MKKIKKIIWVVERGVIKQIDLFSPRKYMKLYNKYLKKIGIHLNGIPRYIAPSVKFDGKGYDKTYIGDNTVISRDVLILNHDYSITCGIRSVGEKIEHESYWLKTIIIGNNTFIGANSVLLPGTNIGNNCIIGAGSVIKGKVKDNSIMVGNPARYIGDTQEWALKKMNTPDYLFEDEIFKYE